MDKPTGAPWGGSLVGLPPGARGTLVVGDTDGKEPSLASFEFVVPGQPLGWARAGGGTTTHRFTPAPQRSYAGALKLFCAAAMKGAAPLDGPLAVDIHAIYPWPASWSQRKRGEAGARWKVSRPDIDNLAKILMDSLNTVAWSDDARICSANLRKYYGDLPCLQVKVRKL